MPTAHHHVALMGSFCIRNSTSRHWDHSIRLTYRSLDPTSKWQKVTPRPLTDPTCHLPVPTGNEIVSKKDGLGLKTETALRGLRQCSECQSKWPLWHSEHLFCPSSLTEIMQLVKVPIPTHGPNKGRERSKSIIAPLNTQNVLSHRSGVDRRGIFTASYKTCFLCHVLIREIRGTICPITTFANDIQKAPECGKFCAVPRGAPSQTETL